MTIKWQQETTKKVKKRNENNIFICRYNYRSADFGLTFHVVLNCTHVFSWELSSYKLGLVTLTHTQTYGN